jgi:signal transduction histidine kinase/PAS domain-containing protein
VHIPYYIYGLILVVATVMPIFLAYQAWKSRPAIGAEPFIVLTLAIAWWSLGYLVELSKSDLAQVVFYAKLEYLGIATLSSAWMAFALLFTRQIQRLTRRAILLLAIEPVIIIVSVWTNEWHYLFWKVPALSPVDGAMRFTPEYGPLFWLHIAYTYIVLLGSAFLIFRFYLRSPRNERNKMVLVLVGVLIPWLWNIFTLSKLSIVPRLDLTPFAFSISGLLLYVAVVRHRLLDIVPIAREAVIEKMNEAVCVLDQNNRVIDANPAALTILQVSSAQIHRRAAEDIFAPWPNLVKFINQPGSAQTMLVIENGGSNHYFAIQISDLTDTKGYRIGKVIVAHDETHQKLAELALAETNEQLERRVHERTAQLETTNHDLESEILERRRVEEKIRDRLNIEHALSITSASFVRTADFDRSVYDTLKTAAHLTGATCAYTLILDDSKKVFHNTHTWHSEHAVRWTEAPASIHTDALPWMMAKMNAGEVIYLKNTASMPSEANMEQRKWLGRGIHSILIFPVYSDKDLAGVLTLENIDNKEDRSSEDINLMGVFAQIIGSALHRKRVEQTLEEERATLAERVKERTAELSAANAELERAVRTKDEFLATMSHELRTPLNAILGLTEAMEEEAFGPENPQQLKALATIRSSGRHLLTLINDILDISKIEAGKLDLILDWIDVERVCNSSLQFVRQIAETRHIDLSMKLTDTPFYIWGDERRLKQILVNLLNNAVKFTHEGGRVGLEVLGNSEQEQASFTVWDTGIGIASEDLSRLFQPFVQVDSSLSRTHEGTGLGLALVARLTQIHNGSVTVESEVGKGSRFIVTLPWVENSPEASTSPEPPVEQRIQPAAPAAEMTNSNVSPGTRVSEPIILLVEDNEANILTTAEYLKSKNYQMVIARNGIEAIARIAEERPALILMDVQMPVMDGLEATRRIRSDPRFSQIPILALTALAMPGDRERCLAAGADDYLSKPISLKNLHTIIQRYLLTPVQQP